MRVRAQDANGDYTMGQPWLVNSRQCVAQLVLTRLLLMRGEWFINLGDGTPYATQILGTGTAKFYDLAVKERILDTPGVKGIVSYSSNVNRVTRSLQIACTIDTIFGAVVINTGLSLVNPNPVSISVPNPLGPQPGMLNFYNPANSGFIGAL